MIATKASNADKNSKRCVPFYLVGQVHVSKGYASYLHYTCTQSPPSLHITHLYLVQENITWICYWCQCGFYYATRSQSNALPCPAS